MKKRGGFTLIEFIFVIVVLGILAAIAIPKFAQTRADAIITKGRTDVSSIRAGIVNERQSRLITGDSSFISGTNLNTSDGLFGGVLTYGIQDSTTSGGWHKVSESNTTNTYDFNANGTNVRFTYTQSDGKFTCDRTDTTYGDICKKMID